MAHLGSFLFHFHHHENDDVKTDPKHKRSDEARAERYEADQSPEYNEKGESNDELKPKHALPTQAGAKSQTLSHSKEGYRTPPHISRSSYSMSQLFLNQRSQSSHTTASSTNIAGLNPPLSQNNARKSFLGLSIGRTHSGESMFSHLHTPNAQVNMASAHAEKPHDHYPSSMVQLRKFFRPKRNRSHDSVATSSHPVSRASTSGPTFTHDAHNNMIVKTDQKFWDGLEGSLTKKYGRMGRMLGSGAGGSVRLITRESDHTTFAVKEFVPRRAHESVKEYAKKCTAEFCIGSTLHHPNVIRTLDIISENNHYYEVMEYAPVDFFSVVMSGKMTRSEINCCFKQITLGVSYLHSMGLAHRDLKLDNCVLTEHGILKLIDFGSAVVFKYPFEDKVVMAHGIVGSDPYMAPEILTSTRSYDPQYVDIWSIAIIYCCMTLRRFPWKAPKKSDPSFSLYCMKDDVPHDYVASAKRHKRLLLERKQKIMERRKEEMEKKKRVELQKARLAADDIEQPLNHIQVGKEHENSEVKDSEVHNISTAVQELRITGQKINKIDKTNGKDEGAEKAGQANDVSVEDEQKNEQPKLHPTHQEHATNTVLDKPMEHSDKKPKEGKENEKTSKENGNVDRVPERRQNGSKARRQIHGPYRLMGLLPHASRPLISKMLSVSVDTRASIDDIFADEWFNQIKYCTVDNDGHVINDSGHHHTIV